MKKYSLIILAFFALTFVSCKKCEECTTVTTTTAVGIADVVTSTTFEACDDEIDEVEGSTTVDNSAGGAGSTVTVTTTCK